MQEQSVIVLGDVHIGVSMRALVEALRDDCPRALRAAGDIVARIHGERGVALVVLPGDVFHRNSINGDELETFRGFSSRMASLGIPVVAIQGNHDYNRGLPLVAAQGLQVLDGEGVSAGGMTIHGVGFDPDPAAFREKVAAVPPCHLLVLHTGFDWNLGYASASSLTDADIPAHVGLVAAGHVHKAERRGRMISLGAVHPVNFSESDPKLLWEFRMGAAGVEVSSHEIPSRRIAIVDVRDDFAVELLRATCAELAACVSLAGSAILARAVTSQAKAVDAVEAEYGRQVVFCRGSLSDEAEAVMEIPEEKTNMTLSDAIPTYISDARPDLREAADRICREGLAAVKPVAESLVRHLTEKYRMVNQ